MWIHLSPDNTFTIVPDANTWDENHRFVRIIPAPEGVSRSDLVRFLIRLGYRMV